MHTKREIAHIENEIRRLEAERETLDEKISLSRLSPTTR
jgi:hypothetical protein